MENESNATTGPVNIAENGSGSTAQEVSSTSKWKYIFYKFLSNNMGGEHFWYIFLFLIS